LNRLHAVFSLLPFLSSFLFYYASQRDGTPFVKPFLLFAPFPALVLSGKEFVAG